MNDSEEKELALRRYSQELSVLNEIARTLNASVDLPTILEQALKKVAQLLGLETGWVLLFDETTGEPYPAAVQNLPKGLLAAPERMAGWCYCLDAFCEGDISSASNVAVVTCTRLQELALTKGDTAGLRYHASIPLRVYTGKATMHGARTQSIRHDDSHDDNHNINHDNHDEGFKRLGMLNVTFPSWRRLTEDELELLYTVGDVLSVAIERARLHAHRLKAAQTEERNRLAREIHDTIAQEFSAIAFQLEAAEVLLLQEADPARIRKNITTALSLSRKGLEEARRSVLDLRAAPLEGRTLAEALAVLVEEVQSQSNFSIALTTTTATDSVPPAIEICLYRIAQEALKNVQRHAGATSVSIRLDATHDEIKLLIDDDGQGFDVDGVTPAGASGRFGLIGMRERARLLGGSFSIESRLGAGVRLTVQIPIQENQPG